jgi:hypothetical protein
MGIFISPYQIFFFNGSDAVDVEIHPFALRGNLKLLVAVDVLEVGTDEGFGDIPIPELVGFFAGGGVGFEVELLVWADKQDIEKILRPAGAEFGCMARYGFAVAICRGHGGLHALPRRGIGIGGKFEVRGGELAFEPAGTVGLERERGKKQ